jgi:MinD superfamily P-loop ATPase
MKPNQKTCSECGKDRERCRAAAVYDDGPTLVIEWVCRQCWKALEYDEFMYEHRKGVKS